MMDNISYYWEVILFYKWRSLGILLLLTIVIGGAFTFTNNNSGTKKQTPILVPEEKIDIAKVCAKHGKIGVASTTNAKNITITCKDKTIITVPIN